MFSPSSKIKTYFEKRSSYLIVGGKENVVVIDSCDVDTLLIDKKFPFELHVTCSNIKNIYYSSLVNIETLYINNFSSIENVIYDTKVQTPLRIKSFLLSKSKICKDLNYAISKENCEYYSLKEPLHVDYIIYVNDMKKLKYLELCKINYFRFIKVGYFELEKLETLILKDNLIEGIEFSVFDSLPSLKKLDLSENMIREVDKNMFLENKHLKYINLENNLLNGEDYIIVNKDSDIFGIEKKCLPLVKKELKSFILKKNDSGVNECNICNEDKKLNLMLSNVTTSDTHNCEVVICDDCYENYLTSSFSNCLFCREKLKDFILIKIN
jgi:hypothetical protein